MLKDAFPYTREKNTSEAICAKRNLFNGAAKQNSVINMSFRRKKTELYELHTVVCRQTPFSLKSIQFVV